MARYRKKPVEIEAVQFSKPTMECPGWYVTALDERRVMHRENGTLVVQTLEGDMTANDGDWIIKGVKGEIYPCKPDIFAITYDPVE